jgi:hypothetical protein
MKYDALQRLLVEHLNSRPVPPHAAARLARARDAALDLDRATELLNDAVPWEELGFFVDGRYLFTQRSLQNAHLPEAFAALRANQPQHPENVLF